MFKNKKLKLFGPVKFTGVFVMLIVLLVPFWIGYGYLYLNVQKSIRQRKIQNLLLKQAELRKRNAALKKELSGYTTAGAFSETQNGLSLLERSRIIHMDLPALPGRETEKKNRPDQKSAGE